MANFEDLKYLTNYGYTESNVWLRNGTPSPQTMVKKGKKYDTQIFIDNNAYIVLFICKMKGGYDYCVSHNCKGIRKLGWTLSTGPFKKIV